MFPIPTLSNEQIHFGTVLHMPDLAEIPDQFKEWSEPHNQIVATWFFKGMTDHQINSLNPRQGVDKQKAIRAIFSILKSFEPKHEHKMAACAYLLHEWFDIGAKNDN